MPANWKNKQVAGSIPSFRQLISRYFPLFQFPIKTFMKILQPQKVLHEVLLRSNCIVSRARMRRVVSSSAASLARKRAITPSVSTGVDSSASSVIAAAAAARYSSTSISNAGNNGGGSSSSCGLHMKLMSQQQHVQQAAGTFSRPGAGFSGVSKRYFSAAPKEDDNEKDKTNASTANDDEETAKAKTKKAGSNGDSLRDAVNRAKAKDGEEIPEDSAASGDDSTNELLHKARDTASSFFGAVSQTWSELLDSGKPRSINKRIHEPVQDLADGEVPEDDDAAADKYEGSTAIMVIDEDEHLTAWERMQRRLSDAPIIQGEF